ncbi:MAG: DNA polymerase III subunit alpha, partial [Pseudomonadaceae bacterium]|nr:DNA polymerase III subunit alpha [Pseudomonadaceae bacterium]
MTVPFVHLRVHSEYSLVDGLVRVKPLIKAVAGAGMPAVAVTDQSNMCSLVKFYKASMGAGIKPICGADIWLASADEDGALTRMTLLVMNGKGYRNLTELVSRGWSEGQSNDLVIIQRDWVKAAAEGLIALSGAREGEVGRALLAGDPVLAEQRLREW